MGTTFIMNIRKAELTDIEQIQLVRNSVTENVLSNPELVTVKDCAEHLTAKGRGWVCEVNNEVVGFSIVDLVKNNVWALFLKPQFEKRGIGRKLHDVMVDWYFQQTKADLWLGTSPNTRAESFYRKAGWVESGTHGTDEIKFEMTFNDWQDQQENRS